MRGLLAILLLLATTVAVEAAVPVAPAPTLDGASFEQLLETRCGQCHTRERIDRARQQGADAVNVVVSMEKQGVRLNPQERSTLTAFWGNPLKGERGAAGMKGAASAYRTLIETRCLQCHTRERIEQAIARQLPLQSLEAVLARRGVALTTREAEVLKVFWGQPLR